MVILYSFLYIYKYYNLNRPNKVLFSYLIKILSSLPLNNLLKNSYLGSY